MLQPSSEDETDEWEQTIEQGGCVKENVQLQNCYLEKHDWRQCKEEVR